MKLHIEKLCFGHLWVLVCSEIFWHIVDHLKIFLEWIKEWNIAREIIAIKFISINCVEITNVGVYTLVYYLI